MFDLLYTEYGTLYINILMIGIMFSLDPNYKFENGRRSTVVSISLFFFVFFEDWILEPIQLFRIICSTLFKVHCTHKRFLNFLNIHKRHHCRMDDRLAYRFMYYSIDVSVFKLPSLEILHIWRFRYKQQTLNGKRYTYRMRFKFHSHFEYLVFLRCFFFLLKNIY